MTENYVGKERFSARRAIIQSVIVSSVLLCGLLIYLRGGFLTSADIRLDTGDLRFRYLGIPLVYNRMPDPERAQLLAVAGKSSVLRPQWRQCASFPLSSSNHTERMCRDWYTAASAWAVEDPTLARLLLEDVANYIETTHSSSGLPTSSPLLSPSLIERTSSGRWVVRQGWREDADVQKYIASKSYIVSTTTPAQ